jgi:uncharacterized membrane protein YoaK (UPF0700 family)
LNNLAPWHRRRVGALAAVAGFIDATGFLVTNGFFVSFMSGNSTRLGIGLAERFSVALTATAIIASFVTGAVIATVLRRQMGARAPAILLLLIASSLATCGVLLELSIIWAAVVLMAAAMGAANLVHEADGEIRFGVTYMTGALVRIAQEIGNRLSGDSEARWLGHFQLWLSLVAGCVAGAMTHVTIGNRAIWVAALAITVLAVFEQPQPTISSGLKK